MAISQKAGMPKEPSDEKNDAFMEYSPFPLSYVSVLKVL